MTSADISTEEGRVRIVGAGEAGVAAAAALREEGHSGRHIQPENWYEEREIRLLHSTIALEVRPASSVAPWLDQAGQQTLIEYDLRTLDDVQGLKADLVGWLPAVRQDRWRHFGRRQLVS